MSSKDRRSKVKVWLRTRPTPNFAHHMIRLGSDKKSVNVHIARDPRKGVVNNQVLDWSFRMDGILHNSSQQEVFDSVASGIVSSALDGYNGTLMAYGQTGAGKTFTMTGATENYKHRGIIPRGLSQLYKEIEQRPDDAINIRISYLEIYNETMYDLLSTLPETMEFAPNREMTVVEDERGVYVKGLSSHLAQTEEEALNLLFEGETNRAIASHSLNKASSRSHCIFTIYVESRSRVESNARFKRSKLNFVDLAGSERLGKTGSSGKTQEEAMYINKSLSFLEQTVVALAERGRDHIPFRQSKLTHFLKDSIGGNTNTALIANVWGEAAHTEETTSTLRFATRMMCIAAEPTVNELFDPVALNRKYEREIKQLRRELAMHDTLANRAHVTYDPPSEQQRFEIRQQTRRYISGELDEIDIINIQQIQTVFDSFRELHQQQEKELEERFRAKYTLVDKTDPSAIAAAQRAGIPITDDGELVGELDRSSFSVGQAPRSARADNSSVARSRRRGGRARDRSNSPTHTRGAASPSTGSRVPETSAPQSPTGMTDRERDEKEANTPTSVTSRQQQQQAARPDSPPSRSEQFEKFKQERGSEINRVLNENKKFLADKKKQYAELAREINNIKVDIDKARSQLEVKQIEREAEGGMFNEDGEQIITEAEYLLLTQLKQLKADYRQKHDALKQTRSEVQYCQRQVDLCRGRLVQEFDQWYAESYTAGAEEPSTSLAAGVGQRAGTQKPYGGDLGPEDEGEKFERLQAELLMENPDAVPFHNAKLRNQQRHTYNDAMYQAQPYLRKPGTPVRIVRDRPPNMLQVQ